MGIDYFDLKLASESRRHKQQEGNCQKEIRNADHPILLYTRKGFLVTVHAGLLACE
jgi:hypothetical protein